MIRTQIQLTKDQHKALKKWAARLDISLAEAVRRCVDDRLREEAQAPTRTDRVREARAAFGRHADPEGRSDIAATHDDHLTDAYGA